MDIRRGDLLDQAKDLAHLPRAAHQGAQHAGFAQASPRHFQLDRRLPLPGGVGQNGFQPGGVDGLGQEIVGAQLHGLDGKGDGAHGCEHDHGHVVAQAQAAFGQLGQQAHAIEPRHLQVRDHNGRIQT